MRALLVTHGNLARELLASARSVYAAAAPIEALSNAERGVEDLRQEIVGWLEAETEPALILVDVGGGSCATAARLAARDRTGTWIVGGVNLAMVLTFLSSHALEPAELVPKLLDRGLNSVAVLQGPGEADA